MLNGWKITESFFQNKVKKHGKEKRISLVDLKEKTAIWFEGEHPITTTRNKDGIFEDKRFQLFYNDYKRKGYIITDDFGHEL